MAILEALASSTPKHVLRQDALAEIAEAYVEERSPAHVDLVRRVFRTTGIRTRSLARDLGWYLEEHGWEDRADAFREEGLRLLGESVRRVCSTARRSPDEIDAVVLVTTTGISTPSLEAPLLEQAGMRPDVVRLPLWGLGCAGGVAGLARAAELADAHADRCVLVLSLELCSLAFLREELDPRGLVAAALFGDGCAGAIISAGDDRDRGPEIVASASHLWPGTGEVMGWRVLDGGLGVVFDRRIPEIVTEHGGAPYERFIKASGVDAARARTLFHPGGPKVLEAYSRTWGIEESRLDDSRAVLRDQGNMSSPTALFVARRSFERAPLGPDEEAVMAALGPGFALELLALRG